MNPSQAWLVVMTKPRMEAEAQAHLARQGYEVYLPYWVDWKRRQGGWQEAQCPMFPRYLFARTLDVEQSIAPIRSTRGVSQIVRFGDEPAWASDLLVQQIRTLEQARANAGSQLVPFKKGDQVQVLDGPFKGVSAEVFASDQQRVILLMQILGQTQKLEFETRLCRVK